MMVSKRRKPATKTEEDVYPRKAVRCEGGNTGEETGRNYAKLMTSPELAAYRVINGAEHNSGIDKHLDVPTLIETLREQAEAVNLNDLSKAEAMLMNQATALQSLFARLTEKAFSATHLPHFDGFMRMGLRAQNQCRATLETLSAIKNPPVVIAKQANIANGPQQVNNNLGLATSRAHKIENEQSKLSGSYDELSENFRAPGIAGGVNPALEALGEIDRAKVKRG